MPTVIARKIRDALSTSQGRLLEIRELDQDPEDDIVVEHARLLEQVKEGG